MGKSLSSYLILGALLAASAAQAAMAAEEVPIVVKLWTEDTDVQSSGLFVRTVHMEIQAVNDSSAMELAQQMLPFEQTMEDIDIVEAYTLKASGEKIPVGPNAIYVQQPQGAGPQYPLFDDNRQKVIVFPTVAGGDTVVYTARYHAKKAFIPGQFTGGEYFARNVAYDEVRETFRAPRNFPLHVETHEADFSKTDNGAITTYAWHYSAPHPKQDDILPRVSPLDHLPRFMLSSFKDRDEFAHTFAAIAAEKEAVTPKIQALADRLTAGITDRKAQAQKIYEWVSSNIRYVAVEIGTGGLVPHAAGDILANAYGDCKDHVVLFGALLKAKHIASEMVLINSGNTYTLPEVATLSPMNHVITWLPDFQIYADTTAGVAPFGVLPFDEYGKPVIHAVKTGRVVRQIPALAPDAASVAMKTTAKMDKDGMVTGDTTVTAGGPFSLSLRAVAKAIEASGPTRFAVAVLKNQGFTGNGSFDFTPPTDYAPDYALTSHFSFGPKTDWLNGSAIPMVRGIAFSELTGDFLMGPAFDETLKDDDATACYSGHESEELSIAPPDGRQFAVLPADAHVKTANLEFTAQWSRAGSAVVLKRDFVSKTGDILCSGAVRAETAKAFAQIREQYRKAQIALNSFSRVVLDDLNAGIAVARRGDNDGAIVLYSKALAESDASPEMLPLVRFSRGNAYLVQRNYSQALADYAEAIRLNSADARYFNNRAVAYKAMNDFDDALADDDQAIRLNPSYAGAYNNRGLVYAAKSDYAHAIADYDQAIHLDPNDASAFNNRGNAKLKMGDKTAGEADIARAKAINAGTKTP